MAHLTFRLIRFSLRRLILDFRFLLFTLLVGIHFSGDVAVEFRLIGAACQLIGEVIDSTVGIRFGVASKICVDIHNQCRFLIH